LSLSSAQFCLVVEKRSSGSFATFRNPPRLVAGERLGSRAPMVAVQKIDLPVLLS
jgi:hypothetical protein